MESERSTRHSRIDPQLAAAGWTVTPFDSLMLTTIPAEKAVEEWPTAAGPAEDSTATIIAPKYFIRHTLPPALSTVPFLDGAGGEETKVPISYDETGWGSSVRLELTSWVARNPVGVSLVDFSWWAPVKWFVFLVAAVFSDQVKDLVRRLFGALVPRKKADVASADTGHAAHTAVSE
jgi:hypothetical protein